jgi:prepilin-type N-terminal cleavage/methylation domain-containing protein
MRLFIRPLRHLGGFTLIELLTVMAVIAILAGLILSISGYAEKKGALARAQAEIGALSTALEAYKTDNGAYPHQPVAVSGTIQTITNNPSNVPSDLLDPRTMGNSTYTTSSQYPYAQASVELYEALSGDLSLSGTGGGQGTKNYITDLRQDAYGRSVANAAVSGTNPVLYLADPFGNCYGYSTANSTSVATGTSTITAGYPSTTAVYPGYNPTFDLWCTGGQTAAPYSGGGATAPGTPGDPTLQWVKSW